MYYKIRKKSEPELFLRQDGSWNKTGKMYDTLGKLRTKITLTFNYNQRVKNNGYGKLIDISDWEIVEYLVSENAIKRIDEVITAKKLQELLVQ